MELLSQPSTSTVVDAIATILLIVLLVERELTRAAGKRWRHQAEALDTVVVPLLIVFVALIAARFAAIL